MQEIFSIFQTFVSRSRSDFSHAAILHPTRLISHPDAAEFLHFLCAKLGKIKVMGRAWVGDGLPSSASRPKFPVSPAVGQVWAIQNLF
jgi:hypothetical protein